MQAVKGYLSHGRFTPFNKAFLPNQTEVMLIFADTDTKPLSIESTESYFNEFEIHARVESLKRIEAALELAKDEDLSDFPEQGLMKVSYDI